MANITQNSVQIRIGSTSGEKFDYVYRLAIFVTNNLF